MTGTQPEPGQVFLVVDKSIINEVKDFNDIPFLLLSAYFVFNIKYPAGCNNFFFFFRNFVAQIFNQKSIPHCKTFFPSISCLYNACTLFIFKHMK